MSGRPFLCPKDVIVSPHILAVFSSSGLPKAELSTSRAMWGFLRTGGTLHKFYPQISQGHLFCSPTSKHLNPIGDGGVLCFLLITEHPLAQHYFQHHSLKDTFSLNLRCCFHLSFKSSIKVRVYTEILTRSRD